MTRPFEFDNSYARLPQSFFARVTPTPSPSPSLIVVNDRLATALGLSPDVLRSAPSIAVMAGNAIAQGSEPIATAYAGHQFGHFSPQLGDGRAILLGEVTAPNGARVDVQLKGAGRTPFSRRGDGRAALGPVLREYIVSEAMAALGVPTTRALAALTTGEPVYRERPLPGAILVRIASSHIRVGTFQYFAARSDVDALKRLVDHVAARHYPETLGAANQALALLDGAVARQAALIAHWLRIGFIHGVMNTDNFSVAGETIDYGPCAFLDEYDPRAVFSSIDSQGRYAFSAQPNIALWNLTRFAECLLPLLNDDESAAIDLAKERLSVFPDLYERHWIDGMRRKLGLSRSEDEDKDLIVDLLSLMAEQKADFTLTFRGLSALAAGTDDAYLRACFSASPSFDAWLARWRTRFAREMTAPYERAVGMNRINPLYIPRNHRIEAVIAAAERDDFSLFHEMIDVLASPFDERPDDALWRSPPEPQERVLQTFCGT